MILRNIDLKQIGGTERTEITFLFKGNVETVWFEISDKNSLADNHSADAFLSFAILLAMEAGEDINISNFSVSPLLLASIEKIQDIYMDWFKELALKRVRIINAQPKIPMLHKKDSMSASFFSGGVDSFDTIINTENETDGEKIKKLVYVYGYDVRLGDKKLFNEIKKHLNEAARDLGKDLIIISTNLREFTERFIGWDFVHGPALITIGHILSPKIKTIYISASNSVGQFTPNGSHPDLDPLFASEVLSIVHYGVERKRIDKILKNISMSETAMKHLRVCWKNSGNKMNCGMCEKCVRTMIALEIAGVLEKTQTFTKSLDSQLIEKIKIPNEGTANLYRELVSYLRDTVILDSIRAQIVRKLNKFDHSAYEARINGAEITKSNGFMKKIKNILFVDFNGVVSYNPFWVSLRDQNHELHSFSDAIEKYLFKENISIVMDWMLGKYTAEQIHEILEREVGVPYEKLFPIFCEECRMIDISSRVLERIQKLRDSYYCILITDNMDSFERFTLENNPILKDSFDKIDNSYVMGRFKKSDDGLYFRDRIAEQGAIIENCILIDDSKNNCALFESLGGKIHTTKNEDAAVAALDSIHETTQSKWEWQY